MLTDSCTVPQPLRAFRRIRRHTSLKICLLTLKCLVPLWPIRWSPLVALSCCDTYDVLKGFSALSCCAHCPDSCPWQLACA